MGQTLNHRLLAAIVLAAIVVAAAVFYLGWQNFKQPAETRVIQLIEERLAQPAQSSESASRLDEARVIHLIEERLARTKGGALSDKEFNARVGQGIIAFVERQREAEQQRPNQLAKNVPAPTQDDHVYGNPKAPITLIEYSDFECPYCKRFHSTPKQLVDQSNGQVNWVYRHFPLEFHNPGAQKQAEASECAAELGGNEAFWKYADAIYARTASGGKGFPVEKLVSLADELGLGKAKFQQCLDSGRYTRKVQQQMGAGQRAGVSGTPGNIFFSNKSGEVIAMPGAVPLEQMQRAVERLRSQRR